MKGQPNWDSNPVPPSQGSNHSTNLANEAGFYVADKSIANVSSSLNKDLKNLHSWLCANKLSLHIGKTNSMLICNHQKLRHLGDQDLNIRLDSETVTQVESLPYLGVTIDSRLTFNDQISSVVKKIYRAIGVLKRCAPFVPSDIRKLLYNALILPHFDYCASVWGITSASNITRLQRLQSRAMRVILNAVPRTHIEDLLCKLKWMSVKQCLSFNRMVLLWKMTRGLAPEYLLNKVHFAHQHHSYGTTSSIDEKLYIPHGHKSSLFTDSAAMWNSLPRNLRNNRNIVTFKKQLTTHILKEHSKF